MICLKTLQPFITSIDEPPILSKSVLIMKLKSPKIINLFYDTK